MIMGGGGRVGVPIVDHGKKKRRQGSRVCVGMNDEQRLWESQNNNNNNNSRNSRPTRLEYSKGAILAVKGKRAESSGQDETEDKDNKKEKESVDEKEDYCPS